ncbi:MAG: NADH:ubiquinone oxidoreductase [Pseudomonadota bacterium]
MGALAGVVLAAALFFVMDYGSAASIFLGLVTAAIVSIFMIVLFCRDLPKPIQQTQVTPAPVAKPAVAPQAATAAPAAAAEKPKAAPKPKPAAKPKAKPAPKAEPVAAAAAGDADKPAGLTAARDGKPDNLKEIKGVGPKLEKLLNSMGYYHFDQVAAWKKKEVAWVDENLEGFKGRVTRDEWVKQAKILAKGGATEFSKKVGKGDVY